MIYLIGTGPMALDYAKVLAALEKQFIVIGRGQKSADVFFQKTGVKPITGGLEKFLTKNNLQKDSDVIIATGTESLMNSLKNIVLGGIKNVLVEKPAAMSIQELLDNEAFLKPYANTIFVAYNRRFYSSVIEAQRLILEDGGLQSLHFEFTEWSDKISPIEKAPGVKENWFFANSTHVVDLAFYFAGYPTDWKSYSKKGNIPWHEKSNYVGAGVTEQGVLFSYISNWESAGRWGIELLTNKRRIYLRPMEDISTQLKGTIEIKNHIFDKSLDLNFKPGLFLQVSDFLSTRSKVLGISSHIENSKNIFNNF